MIMIMDVSPVNVVYSSSEKNDISILLFRNKHVDKKRTYGIHLSNQWKWIHNVCDQIFLVTERTKKIKNKKSVYKNFT